MNIPHLISALKEIESAEVATINPNHRQELENIGLRIRQLLALHGVFIGSEKSVLKPSDQSAVLTYDIKSTVR